jgi:hypothetical protein
MAATGTADRESPGAVAGGAAVIASAALDGAEARAPATPTCPAWTPTAAGTIEDVAPWAREPAGVAGDVRFTAWLRTLGSVPIWRGGTGCGEDAGRAGSSSATTVDAGGSQGAPV